jgi:hypothetical protein
MQVHYNITCSSFIPTKYNYFSTLPQPVDGYVQIWQRFKNYIALEIRTLHLHLPFPILHYSGISSLPSAAGFSKISSYTHDEFTSVLDVLGPPVKSLSWTPTETFKTPCIIF